MGIEASITTRLCLSPFHIGETEVPVTEFGFHLKNGRNYIKSRCKSCLALEELEKKRDKSGYKPRVVFMNEEERKQGKREASNRWKDKIRDLADSLAMPSYEELKAMGLTHQECRGPKCKREDGSGTLREITAFNRDRFNLGRYGHGLARYCTHCTQPYNRKKAAERRGHETKWADEIMSKVRLRVNRKKQAQQQKLDCAIDKDWLIEQYEAQNGMCPYFGFKMQPHGEVRYPLKPSADRLDNNKGYTPDNVILCCLAANSGRNNCSLKVWVDFCKALQAQQSREFTLHPRIEAALTALDVAVPTE